MISGGTLQSLAAAAGGEDASAVTDSAALITDPARAEEVRRRSPITVAPRRGAEGAVIAPMAPAAFINPAVIQRTAALVGAEPFRYREGLALRGPAVTLPLRFAGAGVLSGTQAAVAAAARARPSVRHRVGSVLEKILPGSGFGPSGDRLEAWSWHMTVTGRTTSGQQVRVDVDADGHPGYLATARMLGEAGLLLARAGSHAGPRGMPDAGDGARHRVARAARARAGALRSRRLTARGQLRRIASATLAMKIQPAKAATGR